MNVLTQQLLDAVGLMLIGMGLVFLFLSILIVLVNLVAKYAAPKPSASDANNAPQVVSSQLAQIDPAIRAAITSAIQQYRAEN